MTLAKNREDYIYLKLVISSVHLKKTEVDISLSYVFDMALI